MQFSLPKPKRAARLVLIALGVIAILEGVLVNWTAFGKRLFVLLICAPGDLPYRPWTLFSAGLLTSPVGFTHILFTLIGIYFLSPTLETRWGGARYLRFFVASTVLGFALALGVDAIAPHSLRFLHPVEGMFGPAAFLAALAVAWGRENPTARIYFFFFIPISGKILVYVTLGMCVLGLIFPGGVPEGVIAPFGGLLTGLLLAGSPSPLRSAWLRIKLSSMRRRSGGGVRMVVEERKGTGPALRVIPGGRDEKDKRWLN